MRHLFKMTRTSDWLAVLLLPAWLASGCENDSIRLGGWGVSQTRPAPKPAPPAAAAPVPPPPPSSGVIPGTPGHEGEMPVPVYGILQSRCSTCHQYSTRDPSGWGSILDVSRMIDAQIIVPGDPNSSRLWHRVAVKNDMPFNGARLTPDQKATLEGWIEGLERPLKRPRTQPEILDLLVQDQATAGNDSDTRYVSFADFVDARRPPEEVRTAGAVFKVILNSLSSAGSIVSPVAVDGEGSIWRFRLRDLGWSEQDWTRLISYYPYCVRSDTDRHRALYQRLGTEAPILRGDWFLATALQPSLYHALLRLGDNLDEIARQNLGVDINQNIAEGKVQRIAVEDRWSDQVHERHETRGGGYLWLTYRLAQGEDVLRTPLGPRNRNYNSGRSFSITGTDAIWSLPNGLQAYLLADADGNRRDTVPTIVAQDPRNRRDGSMRTAISCNGCHGVSGLIRTGTPTEIQRYVEQRSMDFSPAEIDQIRRIYSTNGEQILAADADRYRATIFGPLGERLRGTDTSEWDDFIVLKGQYESKIGLRQGALELGTDLMTAQREVRLSPYGGSVLPLNVNDPLVPRDEWMCHYRRIVREVRGASFCADSFTAVELRTLCDNVTAP